MASKKLPINASVWALMGKSLGQRIKRLRETAGLTQEEAAARAKIATKTFQRIENDKGNPTIGSIESIAKAIGCKVSQIYPGDVSIYEIFDDRFSPEALAEAAKVLHELSKTFPVRRAFVLSLLFRDESFLDALPDDLPQSCRALVKSL